MTLQQFEYILAVARYGHFGRAADACNVTQPTLSAMIGKLEEEVGAKLFDRNRQPIRPTPVGEKVILRAREVLEQAESIKDIILEEQQSLEGTFRLGILPTIAPYLLPRFFPQLMKKYPAMDIRVKEMKTHEIKSAVGIGALLTEGIGDTIRVSLSEAPEKEIPVARQLVDMIPECYVLREEALQSIQDDTVTLRLKADNMEQLQLKAAMAVGAIFIDRKAHKLDIIAEGFSEEQLRDLSDSILQAARIKFVKTEYISCPGCGRTLYDLEGTIHRIKAATAHLKGLKIAIMGCIVNGPGEMADADYGYVGAARGKVSLYKAKECVEKNIPEEEAVERLLQFIEEDLKQKE